MTRTATGPDPLPWPPRSVPADVGEKLNATCGLLVWALEHTGSCLGGGASTAELRHSYCLWWQSEGRAAGYPLIDSDRFTEELAGLAGSTPPPPGGRWIGVTVRTKPRRQYLTTELNEHPAETPEDDMP